MFTIPVRAEKQNIVVAITITASSGLSRRTKQKRKLTTLEEGDDLYPRCKFPRHERDIGQLINPLGDASPDLFFALAPRRTAWTRIVVDPPMCVTEHIHPSTHGHSTRHSIPFAHFEDHVGDPSHDNCDFCLDAPDRFEAEFEVWKVVVNDGEDGLIGHAISGLSGRSAEEPGFDLVESGIDVSAEGWRHTLGVCLGGGGCESVLPVVEHGVRMRGSCCVLCPVSCVLMAYVCEVQGENGSRGPGWERSDSKARKVDCGDRARRCRRRSWEKMRGRASKCLFPCRVKTYVRDAVYSPHSNGGHMGNTRPTVRVLLGFKWPLGDSTLVRVRCEGKRDTKSSVHFPMGGG